jgi:hypothetical protein
MLANDGQGRLSPERLLPAEELVQENTERIQIATLRCRLSSCLFRR